MNKVFIPKDYRPNLDAYNTQKAIAYIKDRFQEEFSEATFGPDLAIRVGEFFEKLAPLYDFFNKYKV